MIFEEALKQLREGKKIKRRCWSNKDFYITRDGNRGDIHPYNAYGKTRECGECNNMFNSDDLLCDDWEVLP